MIGSRAGAGAGAVRPWPKRASTHRLAADRRITAAYVKDISLHAPGDQRSSPMQGNADSPSSPSDLRSIDAMPPTAAARRRRRRSVQQVVQPFILERADEGHELGIAHEALIPDPTPHRIRAVARRQLAPHCRRLGR